MINRDVTKSTVIITIAVCIGMFVCSQSVGLLTNARASPPSKEWKWENITVLVRHDIFVRYGDVFEIRNSTIEMDSSWKTIGIRVLGFLWVVNSTIKSIGDNGYYFEVFGAAEIENSRIEGVRSIDPIGEGIIVVPKHFQVRGSTVRSMEDYAMTFYFPFINAEEFIVDSDVGGVTLVKTYINIRNSTLGNLHFRHGPGEFHLFNCTYNSARANDAAFGYIFSWRYLQVHTSQPESNLTITSTDGYMVSEVVTDEDGRFAAWWMSKSIIVDPVGHDFEFDNNPFTFEADRTVVKEYEIPGRGGIMKVSVSQEYHGEAVQDLEECSVVEVEMEPVGLGLVPLRISPGPLSSSLSRL
ncbi:MAG: hypothetical protein KAW09_11625 [Thermoplasmata archaeon]|nr:hypothetical protein [Thermoplasmata archaeon]